MSTVAPARRALDDPHLSPHTCSAPLLQHVLDWDPLLQGSRRIELIVDASSKEDQIHRFRVSLPSWGGAVPLAWAVWQQNTALAPGAYWPAVDHLFAPIAAVLPPGLEVTVLADRATDSPDASTVWVWVYHLPLRQGLRCAPLRGLDPLGHPYLQPGREGMTSTGTGCWAQLGWSWQWKARAGLVLLSAAHSLFMSWWTDRSARARRESSLPPFPSRSSVVCPVTAVSSEDRSFIEN